MCQVLVPVDENERRARAQASYVARLAEGSGDVAATVLFVAPPDTFARAEDVDFPEVDAAVETAERPDAAGVKVNRAVGGRKRSGVQKVLLGSTVQDVLLSTERPVTVTGRSARRFAGSAVRPARTGRLHPRDRGPDVMGGGIEGRVVNENGDESSDGPESEVEGAGDPGTEAGGAEVHEPGGAGGADDSERTEHAEGSDFDRVRERAVEAIESEELASVYVGLIHEDGASEFYFGNDVPESDLQETGVRQLGMLARVLAAGSDASVEEVASLAAEVAGEMDLRE